MHERLISLLQSYLQAYASNHSLSPPKRPEKYTMAQIHSSISSLKKLTELPFVSGQSSVPYWKQSWAKRAFPVCILDPNLIACQSAFWRCLPVDCTWQSQPSHQRQPVCRCDIYGHLVAQHIPARSMCSSQNHSCNGGNTTRALVHTILAPHGEVARQNLCRECRFQWSTAGCQAAEYQSQESTQVWIRNLS